MARAPRESGEFVQLSPSTDALVFGPGKIVILHGRKDASFLGDREASNLVGAWLEYELDRRAALAGGNVAACPIRPEVVRRLADASGLPLSMGGNAAAGALVVVEDDSTPKP